MIWAYPRIEETLYPRFKGLNILIEISVLRTLIGDEIEATFLEQCLLDARKVVLPESGRNRPWVVPLGDETMGIDHIAFVRMDRCGKVGVELDGSAVEGEEERNSENQL